jgi:uncharacterized protein (UPF0276 family)
VSLHVRNDVLNPRPVPARAGIGLRAEHHSAVIARRPDVGWLEVHAENHFASAGAAHAALEALRPDYPLSLHGVGLSLGGTDPLDREHLAQLAAAIRRYQPALVSEHLCWGVVGGRHTNDLLPMPHTYEALRHVAARIAAAEDALGVPLLIENVSSYLAFRDADMSEWEFLATLARETGCRLLLDVNNVYVSARNHGFDALEYLDALPRDSVREIHLAGHSTRRGDLGRIGEPFPEFLRAGFGAGEYAWLPDIATLEWALQTVAIAPSVPGPALTQLADIAPHRFQDLVFEPNPATRLVESRFPIVRIWQTNQPGAQPESVDLDAGGDRVLVRRRGHDLEFVRLDAADFTFARMLARRTPLGLATDASLAVDPRFDLGRALTSLTLAGAFARVELPN